MAWTVMKTCRSGVWDGGDFIRDPVLVRSVRVRGIFLRSFGLVELQLVGELVQGQDLAAVEDQVPSYDELQAPGERRFALFRCWARSISNA